MIEKRDGEFKYFGAVKGRPVSRYGSSGFIAARLVKGVGHVMDTNRVVRIPYSDYRAFARAYDRAVRDGSLIVKTEDDYNKYLAGKAATASAPALESDSDDSGIDDDEATASEGDKKKGNKRGRKSSAGGGK